MNRAVSFRPYTSSLVFLNSILWIENCRRPQICSFWLVRQSPLYRRYYRTEHSYDLSGTWSLAQRLAVRLKVPVRCHVLTEFSVRIWADICPHTNRSSVAAFFVPDLMEIEWQIVWSSFRRWLAVVERPMNISQRCWMLNSY